MIIIRSIKASTKSNNRAINQNDQRASWHKQQISALNKDVKQDCEFQGQGHTLSYLE